MKHLSEIAIKECVSELRSASRLPIAAEALEMLVGWLRPNFERILDHPHGPHRWADHGQRMRNNARHLGALADFFADHADSPEIGSEELKRAFEMVRASCTVRADRTPVAYHYCTEPPEDRREAEEFLRSIAPEPEVV